MPAHSDKAGHIVLEDAYALSKMLNGAGWNGILRDRITPSDIDLPPVDVVFDNRGAIIFCDFSISCDNWGDLGRSLKGQRLLYEGLIKSGPHCAVLCKHSVTPEIGRQIDTLRDVDRFQVMFWDSEAVLSPIYDGAYWQSFVTAWVNEPAGPLRIRRRILGISAGLIKPAPRAAPPTGRTS